MITVPAYKHINLELIIAHHKNIYFPLTPGTGIKYVVNCMFYKGYSKFPKSEHPKVLVK